MMKTVGTYFYKLRVGRGLSRAAVAELAGTSESQVLRIERGEQDPRGTLLLALVDAVRGRIEDVQELVRKQATIEDAERLAQMRLDPESVRELREEQEEYNVDRLDQALTLLEHMTLDELLTTVYEASSRLQSRRGDQQDPAPPRRSRGRRREQPREIKE